MMKWSGNIWFGMRDSGIGNGMRLVGDLEKVMIGLVKKTITSTNSVELA